VKNEKLSLLYKFLVTKKTITKITNAD